MALSAALTAWAPSHLIFPLIGLPTLFSHDRPDGRSCFTALDEANVRYNTAGENIAAGYSTPADVVEGWMNSPGHRANILNPAFTTIGVGCANVSTGYGHYWVQLFID